MTIIRDPAEVRRILEEAQTVAVLGAHDEPFRPAFYVPDYLHQQGYRVLPVNPTKTGQRLWGATVRASLAELSAAEGPVDVVDVFRRSDAVPEHLDDILAMDPPPRVVWLQQGIRHDEVARILSEAGIAVVQDRCMLADHRRWLAT